MFKEEEFDFDKEMEELEKNLDEVNSLDEGKETPSQQEIEEDDPLADKKEKFVNFSANRFRSSRSNGPGSWAKFTPLLGIIFLLIFVFTIGRVLLSANAGDDDKDDLLTPTVETTPGRKLIPKLTGLPEFTKEEEIEVEGLTMSEVLVELEMNGEIIDQVLSDQYGRFIFEEVPLEKGENIFQASVIYEDETLSSPPETVTFDDVPPYISYESPEDQTVYDRDFVLQGETDASKLWVDGARVPIEDEGKFEVQLILEEGQNEFEVRAEDEAGNETMEIVILVYEKDGEITETPEENEPTEVSTVEEESPTDTPEAGETNTPSNPTATPIPPTPIPTTPVPPPTNTPKQTIF